MTENLKCLDDQFAAAFESILKISLSADALIQFSLPTSSGGLGIPTPSGIALSAFASSCHAAEDDVRNVLGDPTCAVNLLDAATEEFISRYGSAPAVEDRCKQSKWTSVATASVLSELRVRLAHSVEDTIRLTHVSLPDSGWWLQATPSQSIGTLLTDRDFIQAAGLRLGLPIVDEDRCSCGAMIDHRGLHRLSCNSLASGRLARHAALNDVVSRAFRQAGVANSKEPTNLSSNDQLRPDGITNMPWSGGRQLIWDVTIRDCFAAGYRTIARTPRAVVARGEHDKRTKYSSLLDEYSLTPLVIDTAGVWGAEALNLVKDIGKRIVAKGGDRRAASFIRQRISIEVQRGNSRMISGGTPPSNALRELDFLSG